MARKKIGRPKEFKPAFCQKAHAMAQAGATDREIAQALDIADRTLYRWRHDFPEFCQALTLGKDSADQRVENSLYHRAVGYSFDSVKIMQHEGQPVIHEYVEHVPPDIGAIQFWLKNRRGTDWRDKHDVALGGTIEINPVTEQEKLELARRAIFALERVAQQQEEKLIEEFK